MPDEKEIPPFTVKLQHKDTLELHGIWPRSFSGKFKMACRKVARRCSNTFPFPALSSALGNRRASVDTAWANEQWRSHTREPLQAAQAERASKGEPTYDRPRIDSRFTGVDAHELRRHHDMSAHADARQVERWFDDDSD